MIKIIGKTKMDEKLEKKKIEETNCRMGLNYSYLVKMSCKKIKDITNKSIKTHNTPHVVWMVFKKVDIFLIQSHLLK